MHRRPGRCTPPPRALDSGRPTRCRSLGRSTPWGAEWEDLAPRQRRESTAARQRAESGSSWRPRLTSNVLDRMRRRTANPYYTGRGQPLCKLSSIDWGRLRDVDLEGILGLAGATGRHRYHPADDFIPGELEQHEVPHTLDENLRARDSLRSLVEQRRTAPSGDDVRHFPAAGI